MEEGGTFFSSPEIAPLFKKGDTVHVFEGTGSGQVGMRSVGWFGTVVGTKEGKYLVRNIVLSGRGSPTLVEGKYMVLQKDFGLGLGSGERTHYQILSKQTRMRIEARVDAQNDNVVKEAQHEIKKLKIKINKETEAHRDRYEKTAAQGNAALKQTQLEYKEQLEWWQNKCDNLQTKKAEQVQLHDGET